MATMLMRVCWGHASCSSTSCKISNVIDSPARGRWSHSLGLQGSAPSPARALKYLMPSVMLSK
eukprot:9396475-Pyramimonas_sp.AAC.1